MTSFRLKLVVYFLLLSLLPLAAAFSGFAAVAKRSETRRLCLMHAWQNTNQWSFLCRSSKEHGAESSPRRVRPTADREQRVRSHFSLSFWKCKESGSFFSFRESIGRKESSYCLMHLRWCETNRKTLRLLSLGTERRRTCGS